MESKYDAFITYRSGPDSAQAVALYDIMKKLDLKPAMDCYDFSPSETFFDEMARCVSESRYTVALVSSHYATSHFTQEEAIMQRILDNKEKKRRLIVTYIEDHPAPLWMQSLVGVRLFQDKDNKSQPELKRLIKHIMLKGEPSGTQMEVEINSTIEKNWNNLPQQVLKYGVYAAAGYGVISAIADMDLYTKSDVVKSVIGEVASNHSDDIGDHIVDNIHGIARGVGHVLKNLFDDIF